MKGVAMSDLSSSLIELVEDNKEYNYKIYETPFTQKNILQLKFESHIWHKKYLAIFGENHSSSTWGYKMYNLFQLTSGSILYLNLYKSIRAGIIDYLSDKDDVDNVWLGSWINFHTIDEAKELDWHTHDSAYHGYLSIDPKNSETNFGDYSIKNQIGRMYIGPGDRSHSVQIKEPFSGNRITVAFNIACSKNLVPRELNLSYIPFV
jgi:hypothetical protein